jgi:hypothetical protein
LQWDALPCASNDEYVDAAKSAGPTTPLTQDAMADKSESGDGASSDEDEDDEGEGEGDGEGGAAKAARGAKATNRYTRRWLDLPPLQVTL